MAKTKFCAGISDISDSYMGIVIDKWGVLHDGEALFPGVVDCLKEFKERKKTVLLLSNSETRSDILKAQLKKMGIGPSLYYRLVTSGEFIWGGLKDQSGIFKDIGKRCYLIAPKGESPLVEDNDVEIVGDIEKADFILITGMEGPGKTLEDYDTVIRKGIQRRLKAISLNPDSMALITGSYLTGPGLLARRYEDSGGIVYHIGKPYQPIFRHCIELLQKKDIYPAQTVMIGDTMAHDILGAHAAGIDTCLVKSGLHAANFAHCETPREVNAALKNLIVQYNNVMPIYLADELKWGKALPDRKHKKRKQPGS
jgi:HAD superfamily hydrolase (TIGR01459 family)